MGRSNRPVYQDALPLVNGEHDQAEPRKKAGILWDDRVPIFDDIVGPISEFPDLRHDLRTVTDFWWYYKYFIIGLAVCYWASFLTQTILFATTNHFDICVNVTRDTLRGSPLVPVVQTIGNDHLYYPIMVATLILAFAYSYLVLWGGAFENYYFNVRHEQSGWKFYVTSVPWGLFVLVIAQIFGVNNIFLLLMLAIATIAGEWCLGLHEYFNGHMFNSHWGSRNRLIAMFEESVSKPVDSIVASIDGVMPFPVVMGPALWVCGVLWIMVVATIFTYFGSAMHQNAGGLHWWQDAVFGIYVAKKGFEVFMSVGYWFLGIWPFTRYAYVEFAHHFITFVMFSLITYFILGAGGNAGFGTSGGCLFH
jgi:hypothetical protein